ncbi:microtubule-associated protein RP/EB family member 1-like [Benincasa hispida]|uniref:microtubule-associated protein RP/EB family member 1-like n=1 Tax=Benincasa hispida TaxID=102211 RepID=UPI001901C11B|nr:microtubule-associated protein RP/EB family member 1-like [Benincasa hispida]
MSSASDSQNQTMSYGNNSPVSSYSSSSVSISLPPSLRKTSKAPVQIKPTHSGATASSQWPSRSKPTTTPIKPPSKTTKAIATLPSKTPQPKPKTTPKPKPKTPSKLRQHSSSTATSKPYTKPAPPPFIPNITPEVFGAILVSLNQSQEEDQVMRSDPPNASLEMDEAERHTMMLEEELEEDREEEERRIGPYSYQSCQSDANEGPLKSTRVTRKRKLILEEEDEQSASGSKDATHGSCSMYDTFKKDLEDY